MNPEDKSKVQSLISDLNGLKSRSPEESKFKEWKEKTEKKLEEAFGKGSEQCGRFRSLRFFDFSRRPGPKDAPLREEERTQFLRGLEEARRLLSRFTDG
jgi:intein/homing endonuclease